MSKLGKIRDKFQNCSYSFQVEEIENGKWGFVGNFILNFDKTSEILATQIAPYDFGLLKKYFGSEEEAIKIGKKVIEEYITGKQGPGS